MLHKRVMGETGEEEGGNNEMLDKTERWRISMLYKQLVG
jgi:hypothetical protein